MLDKRLLKYLYILALSLALWEIAALLVGSNSFPHSWIVLNDLEKLLQTNIFWKDLLRTLWLTTLGLTFGTIAALCLGIFVGLNRSGDLATRGSINFVRAIPSVVFLPLLIASIGASERTAVILTTFVVTFTFVTYVTRGIADTDKGLIESAQLINLSWVNKIFYLYLPSTVSLLGTGIRLSANRAFGTVVTAGIVAGTPGLGARLFFAETNGDHPRVFSYVLVMGILGVAIYSTFTRIEKRLFIWRVSV